MTVRSHEYCSNHCTAGEVPEKISPVPSRFAVSVDIGNYT
jgi:hypothetical protein